MTTDDEQIRDTLPVHWVAVPELPAQLPTDRLDYGDAEQLAEMSGAAEPPEEPLILVDEPALHRPPYDRTQQRRDERPLPT
ncbi:hypothetical protein [Micromonospora craniellae]|uniref:Uncharacterized protein n=1 Tax=Micromonospora craniellae TaxID=2294034 RepID=A0A372FXK8_9ACTN|nr:hypothetical protein [Micromonospora craniellae]QOC95409.1 hypothetical protein ID554_17820 [Micromonospora craniellae]RFS45266.1 hypothetical protein D0Q02_17740 [Micromonospora craniellae]